MKLPTTNGVGRRSPAGRRQGGTRAAPARSGLARGCEPLVRERSQKLPLGSRIPATGRCADGILKGAHRPTQRVVLPLRADAHAISLMMGVGGDVADASPRLASALALGLAAAEERRVIRSRCMRSSGAAPASESRARPDLPSIPARRTQVARRAAVSRESGPPQAVLPLGPGDRTPPRGAAPATRLGRKTGG